MLLWANNFKKRSPKTLTFPNILIKGLEKGGFRDHLLINAAGTTQWTKFVKFFENVESARGNTQPVPMALSAIGSLE